MYFLDRPYQLLDGDFFNEAEAEMEPLVRAMFLSTKNEGEGAV
jgi:hypothetical protein